MKPLVFLLAALLACISAPATANVVTPPTFEQLMAESNLVIIGTVTGVNRGDRDGYGATATLSVQRALKGEQVGALTVSTYSRIAEMNPRCCIVGATYLMFLRSWEGQFVSVWGLYGMVQIGAPPGAGITIVPEHPGRRRN